MLYLKQRRYPPHNNAFEETTRNDRPKKQACHCTWHLNAGPLYLKHNMKNNNLVAYLIAPPIVPFVYWLILSMFYGPLSGSIWTEQDSFIVLIISGSIVSYVAVFLLGIPTFKCLRYFNKLSYYSIFFSGFINGLITGAIVISIVYANTSIKEEIGIHTLLNILVLGFSAGCGAYIFASVSNDVQ